VRRVLALGAPPLPAAVGGVVAVALLALALAPFQDDVSRAGQGLVLVLPVVGAAVVGGRWPAYVVAGAATLAFALVIPPVGSLVVELEQDLVALVVFAVVAVVVSTVVAGRIEVLHEVERQRAALLRSVSHDLRTPLSAIRAGSTELLDGADHDPATRRRLLELIDGEAERLDRLVANLLSMSRIEAGALEPRRQAVDLGELVELTVPRLARRFTDLHLEVDVAPDVPVILADHTQLEQVITNLLENAARHSPPGGTVRLAVRAVGDGVELTVDDEGPGVDPADAIAIFEPFRTAGPSATSGIGLAICKAIVEAHAGTISVGGAPGGGARFTVTLPGR
jgi:two-component system sensor histidine kinase KdpD